MEVNSDGLKQPETPELSRLRGLGEWMRSVGATELSLGDLHIKLSPSLPVTPGRVKSAAELDEARALSAEEHAANAEDEAKRAHDRYWRRVTRSSGAPIPEFKPKAGT